jgi:sulfoxide reductase heme-binding subunit YedZ
MYNGYEAQGVFAVRRHGPKRILSQACCPDKALLHPAAVVVFAPCLLPFAGFFVSSATNSWVRESGRSLDPCHRRLDLVFHLHCAGRYTAESDQPDADAGAFQAHARSIYFTWSSICYSWFDMVRRGRDSHDIIKRPFHSWSVFSACCSRRSLHFIQRSHQGPAKRWQLLHKLVYLIAAQGLLHFFLMRAGKK